MLGFFTLNGCCVVGVDREGWLFCGAVLEFGVVVALSFLSMSGRVLVASVLAGCCSGWLFRDVVGRGEDFFGGGEGGLSAL